MIGESTDDGIRLLLFNPIGQVLGYTQTRVVSKKIKGSPLQTQQDVDPKYAGGICLL